MFKLRLAIHRVGLINVAVRAVIDSLFLWFKLLQLPETRPDQADRTNGFNFIWRTQTHDLGTVNCCLSTSRELPFPTQGLSQLKSEP